MAVPYSSCVLDKFQSAMIPHKQEVVKSSSKICKDSGGFHSDFAKSCCPSSVFENH